MKRTATIAVENPEEEIAALVQTLHETQERLQELAGGEVDAVMHSGGQSYLLREAQEKLRRSEALERDLAASQSSILNALPAHIALIDHEGVILSVNDVWRRFGESNGQQDPISAVGQNYLEVCACAHGDCAKEAQQAAAGIRAVLSGATNGFSLEYPCHSPTEQRWFQLIVSPMDSDGAGGAVVMHIDVTERRMATEHLQANEILLRQFIRHAPAAIAMLDTQMRYIQVSEQWMQDYHLGEREMIGKSHYEIFPDLPEDWKEIHRRALAGAVDRCDEAAFLRADGSMDWVQWDVRPWHRAGGEVGGVLMFTEVITERKRAEEALRMSERRFRQISEELAKVLDSSLDVICTFDAQGCFARVNAACEKTWGYQPGELLGTPYIDKVLDEDRPKTIAVATEIMAGKPTTSFENRYVRKDGAITHMMWSAWWSEADGSMFCVARDFTEARKAEEDTRELAERLELAAKASEVGIWDWDIVTGTMHWDDQMYVLYGATRGDSPSGVELWRGHLHPDDEERANAEIAEALRPDGRPFDTVFRVVVPPDGAVRHIHAQSRVFRDEGGRPLRMLGTNWDVTEQVERENMLRQKLENESSLLQQALAGEKAKSEFLAVMSHEIRTPMNGVLGFAEMLVNSPTLSAEDRDLSQTIVSSGEALLRILDDILDFSRIEAGQLAIEKRALSPREIVEGIQALFTRQIHEKGLQFFVSLDASLPEAFPGDAGRIRQILVNLVGNALKFTEQGSIELAASASIEAGSLGVMKFVVRDTGAGIAPDRASAIFEAFTQADSSISRRHGGTGLGLTISRRLAELMGGDLQMSSGAVGTTFSLRIPFTPGNLPAGARGADRPPGIEMDEGFAIRHALRILVVEDDRVNLKLIVSVLRKLGYDPLIARNGVEAIAACAREKTDCVIMDIQMPEMDGIEAARKIRGMESSRHLPPVFIAALTANILREDRDRCLAAGMNIYLNKPVKRQAIAAMLIEAWYFRRNQAA